MTREKANCYNKNSINTGNVNKKFNSNMYSKSGTLHNIIRTIQMMKESNLYNLHHIYMVYSFTYLLQHFASLQEFGCSYVIHTEGSSVMPHLSAVWIIVTYNTFPCIMWWCHTKWFYTL